MNYFFLSLLLSLSMVGEGKKKKGCVPCGYERDPRPVRRQRKKRAIKKQELSGNELIETKSLIRACHLNLELESGWGQEKGEAQRNAIWRP